MPKVEDSTATWKPARARERQRGGYVRVSSLDQNETRQLDGLELDKTFLDKASGKDTERPQLTAMLHFVVEGHVGSVTPWIGSAGILTIIGSLSLV